MPSQGRFSYQGSSRFSPGGYSRCRKTVQLLISVVDFHSRSLLSPGVRQMNDPFTSRAQTNSLLVSLPIFARAREASIVTIFSIESGVKSCGIQIAWSVSMGVFLCIWIISCLVFKGLFSLLVDCADSLLRRWSWMFVQFVNCFE